MKLDSKSTKQGVAVKTKKKIVALSGAGISAESGINTFRDSDGLWEGHDVYEVASREGFAANPDLVLDFYNQRRRQLLSVAPNLGHHSLVTLEKDFDVVVITQNVDDLHERAGSTNVIHLHGELLKAQSTQNEDLVYPCKTGIVWGDKCEQGSQLRPFIVWFGEMVPELERAANEVMSADIVVIVGTSMQVYPAASLVGYAGVNVPIYYVDPKPATSNELRRAERLTVIEDTAANGLPKLVKQFRANENI